jgi:homospermidine synthase
MIVIDELIKSKVATLRFLIVGFGTIGQGLTPLLIQTLGVLPSQITAWAADLDGDSVAQDLGIKLELKPLTPDNYTLLLAACLRAGDILLNLAVDVSSRDLINWCQQHDVLYLDTSIEPWAGGYQSNQALEKTTNHWLRHEVLALKKSNRASAVIAHGANPGLISHLAKHALQQLAKEFNVPFTPNQWGELALKLGVQVIQVAEKDTQTSKTPLSLGEFRNTWSVPGFISELDQPCEAGWGSHELVLPYEARWPSYAPQTSLFWSNPKHKLTQVKSWVPSIGQSKALLITHNESISLTEFLTVQNNKGQVIYRPTIYFAYQPCPQASLSINNWLAQNKKKPTKQNVMPIATLQEGQDELGVLLCHSQGAYWYGSTLTIQTARTLVPYNNATTLQVVAGVLGGIVWMLNHPRAGITEAEAMDSEQVLAIALPYLGIVKGTHTSWQAGPDLSFQSFILP